MIKVNQNTLLFLVNDLITKLIYNSYDMTIYDLNYIHCHIKINEAE